MSSLQEQVWPHLILMPSGGAHEWKTAAISSVVKVSTTFVYIPLSLCVLKRYGPGCFFISCIECDAAFQCQVRYGKSKYDWKHFYCPGDAQLTSMSRRLDWDPEPAARESLKQWVSNMKLMDTGSTSLKAIGQAAFQEPGRPYRVDHECSFDMKCAKDVDDFPNACSGTLDMTVWWDPSEDNTRFLTSKNIKMGIALYAFSNYTAGNEFQRVLVAKYAALSRGICWDDFQVLSGDCLGLSQNSENMVGPKAGFPADPPQPPDFDKDVWPRLPKVTATLPPNAPTPSPSAGGGSVAPSPPPSTGKPSSGGSVTIALVVVLALWPSSSCIARGESKVSELWMSWRNFAPEWPEGLAELESSGRAKKKKVGLRGM